jgi:hypothetical protein
MRALRAALAFAYTASFVAACLSGCMAAGTAAHGCCPADDGVKLSRPGTDCCAVTPALTVEKSTSVAPVMAPLPPLPEPVRFDILIAAPIPVPAAAGPPLILRI